jgi:folate-binding protein YgfZ
MSFPTDYTKVLHEAGFFLQSDAGYLDVQGPDRLEFLQRQTTNDLQMLNDDLVVKTVLTSPIARIIDVLYIIFKKDSLGIITLPGRAQTTFQFLSSRIFFNDQVSLTDKSSQRAQILVEGQKAAQVFEKIGLTLPNEKYEIVSDQINDEIIKIIPQDGLLENGFRIITKNAHEKMLLDALLENGATPISEDTLHILRVESGLPGPVGELTQDYTPLEINLENLISPDKGCYTGQEVIARQITYDKVARRMVGLSLKNFVLPGNDVHTEGKNIGKVTSSALSPRYGPIALAIIKRPYNKSGVIVKVGNDEIPGVVTNLPFN